MFVISTEIQIDAPKDLVWDVISDFENYQNWNTQLHYLDGEVELGQRLKLKLEPMGHKGYTFQPTLHVMKPQQVLAWKGNIYSGGMYSAEHRFTLESTPSGGTRLINQEICRGLMTPIMQFMPLTKNTAASFDWLNEEIRDRCMALTSSKQMAS